MAASFDPSWRLIPSRFPPIGAFDTVASADDLAALMELEGWTNDHLVVERLNRLPRDQWVFGVRNASVVMASFLHAAPAGTRFTGPELGAWYASAAVLTAIAEVAHHMRRELFATKAAAGERTFRAYSARVVGDGFFDLRGQRARHRAVYSRTDYAAAQAFGEARRADGSDGILYDSLRHRGGQNVVVFRPKLVTRVTQEAHWRLEVPRTGKVRARQLAA